MRYTILLLILSIALFNTGCSLSNAPADDLAEPIRQITQTPQQTAEATAPEPIFATATATLRPTNTAQATPRPADSSSGVQPPTRVGCTVRADWPVYVVASGDTLGSIARRVNSTVGELSTANCLANANAIFTGQSLRVPRTPVTTTDAAIILFRLTTNGTTPLLEWQTRGGANVLITVVPPSGTGGDVVGTFPANGTTPLPALDQRYAPAATFWITLMDAAGREVPGRDGRIASSSLYVPLATLPTTPSVVSFTATLAPDWGPNVYSLAWETRGAASVRIVIQPPRRGSGVSLGTNPASGATRLASLDPAVFEPAATAYLYLQDANGYDVYDANGQAVYAAIELAVRAVTQAPAIFTADQASVMREGIVRLRWNVPNALYPLAITRLNADLTSGEVIASELAASGTLDTQIPTAYTSSVSFRLNGVAPTGQGEEYGYVTVTIQPSPAPACPTGSPMPTNGVTVEPVASTSRGCLELTAGSTVTVRFPAAETRAIRSVDFYFLPSSGPSAGTSVLIGTDQTAADGLSIPWQVPSESVSGTVYAAAAAVSPSENFTSDQTPVLVR